MHPRKYTAKSSTRRGKPGLRSGLVAVAALASASTSAAAPSAAAPTASPPAPAPTSSAVPQSDGPYGGDAAPVAPEDRTLIEQSCLRSFNEGQRLRASGQLLEARRELATCAQPSCPELMANPCSQWLAELRVLVPSIVVTVTNADGVAIGEGRVEIDGAFAPVSLAGRPFELDPGKHLVRVHVRGFAPEERAFELAPGTHALPLRFRFEPPAPSAGKGGALSGKGGAPPGTGPGDDAMSTLAVTGWTAVALAAAGVVVGAVTGGLAAANKAELDEDCAAGACTDEDIDSGVVPAHVSTVSFAVAGVGALVGIVCLALDSGPDDEGATSAATSELVLGAGSLAWRGRF
jgi:hypothetical protein